MAYTHGKFKEAWFGRSLMYPIKLKLVLRKILSKTWDARENDFAIPSWYD